MTRSTQTLPIPGLVDHNNIIMEETASILIAAMSERDMMIWPLRDHELDLLRCLPFQGPVDHNVCMFLASVSSSLHFQAYRGPEGGRNFTTQRSVARLGGLDLIATP